MGGGREAAYPARGPHRTEGRDETNLKGATRASSTVYRSDRLTPWRPISGLSGVRQQGPWVWRQEGAYSNTVMPVSVTKAK